MAITKKPKAASQVDVEALILKGGSVAEVVPKTTAGGRKLASVVLRLPVDLMEQIEHSIRSRPVKIPRHTWLLEAVVEKLERDLAQTK